MSYRPKENPLKGDSPPDQQDDWQHLSDLAESFRVYSLVNLNKLLKKKKFFRPKNDPFSAIFVRGGWKKWKKADFAKI